MILSFHLWFTKWAFDQCEFNAMKSVVTVLTFLSDFQLPFQHLFSLSPNPFKPNGFLVFGPWQKSSFSNPDVKKRQGFSEKRQIFKGKEHKNTNKKPYFFRSLPPSKGKRSHKNIKCSECDIWAYDTAMWLGRKKLGKVAWCCGKFLVNHVLAPTNSREQ